MENRDLPVHPSKLTGTFGLSKREHIAALALQGLLANQSNGFTASFKEVSTDAVYFTDALLKALEEN